MRPRRDHGDELVEHGESLYHIFVRVSLSIVSVIERCNRYATTALYRREKKRVRFGFPTSKSLTVFEFFQSFPIFFLSLLRACKRRRRRKEQKNKRKFLPADSSSSRCLRDESENALERQKPKTTTTFLLFVFERSRFKRERKRD